MTTSVIQNAFHTPVGPVSLQRKNASGSIIAINLHRDIISDGMPMPSPSSAPDEVTDTAEITKPIQIRRSAVFAYGDSVSVFREKPYELWLGKVRI